MTVLRAMLFLMAALWSAAASGVSTTNNDSSCDISVTPAATLLLPFFEVDYSAPQASAPTTIFTITNTSARPQIARVTIWTDWSFPALTFNIFLTGYDVQAINLYDVIARGLIGSTQGTSSKEEANTGDNNRPGTVPFANSANPNFLPSAATACGRGRLPGSFAFSGTLLRDVQSVLTTGRYLEEGSCGPADAHAVGSSNHGTTAVGFVTVDVVATCSPTLPTNPAYFTTEILFDNVLLGDYQDLTSNSVTGNFARGNPMVHIRAIPEGGPAGTIPPGVTNLPYTFYDRYTATGRPGVDRRVDRRQPLPSTFAVRFLAPPMQTRFKIWREGLTGSLSRCRTGDYARNAAVLMAETVRFDEHENATVSGYQIQGFPDPQPASRSASQIADLETMFGRVLTPYRDGGGWIYLNLTNGGSTIYSSARAGFSGSGTSTVAGPRQSQNWLTVSMFAEGRYAVEFDAASLGNGCSPLPTSRYFRVDDRNYYDDEPIGPAGGTPVCPAGAKGCTAGTASYPGTNVNP